MKSVSPSRGGFWFVSTLVDVQADLPAVITPNVRLQRATDQQIKELKDVYPAVGFFGHRIEDGREVDSTKDKTEQMETGEPFKLPREKWRYFVLAYSGDPEHAYGVKQIFLLGEPSCTCRTVVITSEEYGEGNRVAWGAEMYAHTKGMRLPLVRIITDATLRQVKAAHTGLMKIHKNHPEIPRAIDMLNDLRMVPNHADLYMLGLFAIIELLLTHNPQDRDNADSLTHQVSTKIPLLDKKLPERIDYRPFTATPAKVWRKLYGYRSKIAHGAKVDFARDFRELKSPDVARDFVQMTCQKLIRHAIQEPDLYEDLKAV